VDLKKIQHHKINSKPFFIKGFFIDKKICKSVIKFFENNKKEHKRGLIEGQNTNKYFENSNSKISTDIHITPLHVNELIIKKYLLELKNCLEEYKKIFPYCSLNQSKWALLENFNIQKYKPKEGYFEWHHERNGHDKLNNKRHLVFMTYLNSLKNGGTEFYHQKLKLEAEQGLTVIWPADWTYTHKGVISLTRKKYIVTGWYSFV